MPTTSATTTPKVAASKSAESVQKLADKTLAATDKATAELKENMKTGFDKAMTGLDDLNAIGRDNVEAFAESATLASKALQDFGTQVIELSRSSLEESVAATKAVLSAKDLNEAFGLQQDYVRQAFDSYVKEFSKLSDKWLEAAKEVSEPLAKRAEEVKAKIQTVAQF